MQSVFVLNYPLLNYYNRKAMIHTLFTKIAGTEYKFLLIKITIRFYKSMRYILKIFGLVK
jgi:hypothetical protein